MDGVLQNQWSGDVAWTQTTYTLEAGTRILKWEYIKDGSVDSGSDCAWIDDIIFPASTTPSSFFPPQNLSGTPGNGFVNLAWQAPQIGTPAGYKIFRNNSLLTTVTALSYTDNDVVNETTYSYYLKAVYSGGESDPTPTITVMPTAIVPMDVIIGTGTASTGNTTASPINVYFQSLHGQAVYTAAELNAAGIYGPINITQLGFNVTGLPTLAMPDYVVRMKHTSAANVASWISSSGLSTVYSVASYQPGTTGYDMLTLGTPFLWNGTDNILIDTAFGLIGAYTSTGTVQYSTVSSGYRYVRGDNADQTAVFTGGSYNSSRPNIKLTFQPNTTGPIIAANPSTLDFGNVAVGTASTQQFTIQNTGDEILTGSISTPAGYTVALASREADSGLSTLNGKDRNTLAFSINAGSSKTYNLAFIPTASVAYAGNVALTSNATNSSILNISVSGTGYVPPTMIVDAEELSASLVTGEASNSYFTISNTGSLALTYSISIAGLRSLGSADEAAVRPVQWFSAAPLSGSIEPGANQAITGYFSAVGMEPGLYEALLTINGNDPLHPAETVQITMTVNPVNAPSWIPVLYPHNPATLHAVVTIDNIPAQLNDMVAAFVGNECRGVGEIVVIDRSTAYSTLLVNLASSGETVNFKIYSYAQDTIYPVPDLIDMEFGVVYGSNEDPVPLNGTNTISIATPVLAASTISGIPQLSWNAVNYANRYRILASGEPLGNYQQIGTTSDTFWVLDSSAPWMFYRVIAEQYLPSRGAK